MHKPSLNRFLFFFFFKFIKCFFPIDFCIDGGWSNTWYCTLQYITLSQLLTSIVCIFKKVKFKSKEKETEKLDSKEHTTVY